MLQTKSLKGLIHPHWGCAGSNIKLSPIMKCTCDRNCLTYHCYCDLCCIVRFILGESILLSLPCESKPQCEPVKKTREWSAIHHHLIYTSLYPAPSSFHPHKPTWLLCHNYHKSGFVKLKLMHSIYIYTEQAKKKHAKIKKRKNNNNI